MNHLKMMRLLLQNSLCTLPSFIIIVVIPSFFIANKS